MAIWRLAAWQSGILAAGQIGNMAACQFSVSLLFEEERRPLSLYREERVSLFSIEERQRGESVSLLDREEADSF